MPHLAFVLRRKQHRLAAGGCYWRDRDRAGGQGPLGGRRWRVGNAGIACDCWSRPATAELALRFGKVLGQSPQYWLNLQAAYDLAQAKAAIGRRLKDVHLLPQVA
jgi:hypothetical protein